MKDFRQLRVWEKAHHLTLDFYKLTAGFPRNELFGLTAQIRRCASSIPANIAEGCGKAGNSEFHRFLQVSCGSSNELEYHLLLAKDLGYIKDADYQPAQEKLLELKRMLVALTAKVASERRSQ
jgi:four helix bundle protein